MIKIMAFKLTRKSRADRTFVIMTNLISNKKRKNHAMLSQKKTGYEMSEVGEKKSNISLYVINHLNRNTSYINQFLNTRERCDGEISVLLG